MSTSNRVRRALVFGSLSLAVTTSAHAQTPVHNDKVGNPHKSKPPSSSALPGPAGGASPLAWVDDASLLAPGTMSLTVSAMRWTGTDLSEVDFPIVDVSVGLRARDTTDLEIDRVGTPLHQLTTTTRTRPGRHEPIAG